MVDVSSKHGATETGDQDQIFKEVCGLVTRFAPPGATLAPGTELAAQLNIDSVAAMDLVMEIEDHYSIDIPINEIADLRTLGDLADLVRRHVKT
jgi:acyl carrier protein